MKGAADYWTIKNMIVTNREGWVCIDIVGYAANLTISDSVICGDTLRRTAGANG